MVVKGTNLVQEVSILLSTVVHKFLPRLTLQSSMA